MFRWSLGAFALLACVAMTFTSVNAATLYHYTFDENGGTDIADLTDGSVDGTVTGSGFFTADTPGPIDGRPNVSAMDFATAVGNAEGVAFNSPFAFHADGPVGDATLEFFIKPAPTAHSSVLYTGCVDGGCDINRFNIHINDGGDDPRQNMGADYANPENERSGIGGPGEVFVIGAWQHVAIVRRALGIQDDGGANNGNQIWEWSWYRNGELVSGPSLSDETLPDHSPWHVAARECCQYRGMFDELRVSDAALTPGEFLMAEAPLNFNVHISFNEGSGSDVIDQTRGDIGDILAAGNGYSTDVPPNYTGGPGGDPANPFSYDFSGGGYAFVDAVPFALHKAEGDATLEWFANVPTGTGHTSAFWTNGGEPGDSGQINLFFNANFASAPNIYAFDYGGQPITGTPFGAGHWANAASAADFPTDEWIHVAIVKTDTDGAGGNMYDWRTYVNGEEAVELFGQSDVVGPGEGNTWAIAGDRNGGRQHPVKMDEIRLSDSALAPEEFLNFAPPTCPEVVALYSFEEGAGTDIVNSITGNVDGTLLSPDGMEGQFWSTDTAGGVAGSGSYQFGNNVGNMTGTPMSLHRPQGDATLEWYSKVPTGTGHTSAFWTNGAQPGDSGQINLFFNANFAGAPNIYAFDYGGQPITGTPFGAGAWANAASAPDFPTDEWAHVAIVKIDLDGAAGNMYDWHTYVNGVDVPELFGQSDVVGPGENNTWGIAGAPSDLGRRFPGLMDEIRLTLGALNCTEFLNAPVTTHITFDEGSGSDIIDLDGTDIGDILAPGNGYSTDVPAIRGGCVNAYSYDFAGGGYARVDGALEPFALHCPQGDATLEWFANVPAGTGHTSAFWTNGGGGDSGQINLFFNANFAGADNIYAFDYGGQPITGTPFGAGHWANAASASDFPTDEWIHVAIVKTDIDGPGGNMYDWNTFVNGVVVSELFGQSDVAAPGLNNSWGIAGQPDNGSRLHPVKMDEIRLTKKALTASEFLFVAPEGEVVDPAYCFRFEDSPNDENGVPGTLFGTAGFSTDVPSIIGLENNFSLDTGDGGSGLLVADADKPFIFHANSGAGDSTLEWFMKYPTGLGHSSPFFTHADAGGGLPDNNRFNIFLGSCFGGGGDASICANHVTGDVQGLGFFVDHSVIASLNADEWNHVAFTRTNVGPDMHEFRTYYNGQEVGNGVVTTGPMPENPDFWAMGARNYTGLMDEVKASNRILNPSQFMQQAPPELDGFYRFEDVTAPGDSFTDEFSGAVHGVLEGNAAPSSDVAGATIFDGLNGLAPHANATSLDLHGSSARVFGSRFGLDTGGTGDATIEWFHKLDPGFGHSSLFWTRPDGNDADRWNIFVGAGFAGNPNGFAADYRFDGNMGPIQINPTTDSSAQMPAGVWVHNAITRVDEGGTFAWNWLLDGQDVGASSTGLQLVLPGATAAWQVNGRGPGFQVPMLFDEYRQTLGLALAPSEFLTATPPATCVLVGESIGDAIAGAGPGAIIELEAGVHQGARLLINKDITIRPKAAGGAAGGSAVIVEWPSTQNWETTVQPGVAMLYENATSVIENIHFRIDVSDASPSSAGGLQIAKFSGPAAGANDVTFNNCIFEYTGTAPADVNVFNRNQMRHEGPTTTTYNNCEMRWSNDPVAFPSFVNNIAYFVPGGATLTINLNDCILDNTTDTNGKMRSIGSGGGGGGNVNVNLNNCIFQEDEHGGLTHQQAWISTATATTHVQANFCDFQSGADRFIGHEGNPNVTTTLNGCVFSPGGEAFLPDPGAVNTIRAENTVFLDAGNRFRSGVFCCENESRAYVFRNCTFQDNDDQLVFTAPNFADATEFSNCLFNMPNSAVIMNVFAAAGNAPIGGNNMSNGGGGASTTAGGDSMGEATPGLTIVADLLLDADGYHLTECSPALGGIAPPAGTPDTGDASLALWLKADDLSGGLGDRVNVWTDASAHGTTLEPRAVDSGFSTSDDVSDPDEAPILKDGGLPSGILVPSFDRDGDPTVPANTTHRLYQTNNLGAGDPLDIGDGSGLSVIVLFRPTITTSGGLGTQTVVGKRGTGSSVYTLQIPNSGTPLYVTYDANTVYDASGPFTEGVWHISAITVEEAGAMDAIRWFDSDTQTDAQTLVDFTHADARHNMIAGRNASTPEPFGIGGHSQECCGHGETFAGQVAEVIVYNRTLDESELNGIAGYLSGKYFGGASGAPPATANDVDGEARGSVADIGADELAGDSAPSDTIVVAQDGSGDFLTIQEGIDAAGACTKTISVKSGTYTGFINWNKAVDIIEAAGEDAEVISTGNAGDMVFVGVATGTITWDGIDIVLDNPNDGAALFNVQTGDTHLIVQNMEWTDTPDAIGNGKRFFFHGGTTGTLNNITHLAENSRAEAIFFAQVGSNITVNDSFISGVSDKHIWVNQAGPALSSVTVNRSTFTKSSQGGSLAICFHGLVTFNDSTLDLAGGTTRGCLTLNSGQPNEFQLNRCTLDGTATPGGRLVNLESEMSTASMTNSILNFTGTDLGVYVGVGGTVNATHCTFFSTQDGARAIVGPEGAVTVNVTVDNNLFSLPNSDRGAVNDPDLGGTLNLTAGTNLRDLGGAAGTGDALTGEPGTIDGIAALDASGRLTAGSKDAINAAVGSTATDDIDGNARPSATLGCGANEAAAEDLGASEYQADDVVCDDEPPTITCSGDVSVSGCDSSNQAAVSFDPPTVSDNLSAVGDIAVSCDPMPGSVFNEGDTTVTCTATDEAGNSAQCTFTVSVDCGGLQRPGDMNQDGANDQTDQLNLLENIFLGLGAQPCSTGAANLVLLDANGDSQIDQSDAVYNLISIFLGGAPHVQGEDCVNIVDCPEECPAP